MHWDVSYSTAILLREHWQFSPIANGVQRMKHQLQLYTLIVNATSGHWEKRHIQALHCPKNLADL